MNNAKQEKQKSKFNSRKTSMKLDSVYGSVHASICYCNDEANSITFTQWRKDFNYETNEYNKEETNHHIYLSKKDLQELVDMMKLNELVK
jgi:hypothetical protein